MNHLISETVALLRRGGFEYAFCGGFAIELFLDKEVRKHGDIDVSAYWDDRDKIILYMQSLGWDTYEMCGGGMAHRITDILCQKRLKRNIFCFKDGCELIKLTPQPEGDMVSLEFFHIGQQALNFVEFLFNDKSETDFLYSRNNEIRRCLPKAILKNNGIPYLAPEIVLLYKSTDIMREGYQLDFDQTVDSLDGGQRDWLAHALRTMYPEGHRWLGECIANK